MRFEVRALDPSRRVVSVALEAPDAASAVARAQAQGLAVLSARRALRLPALGTWSSARFPLLQFTQELVALLRAGLSLPETLEVMVEKEGRAETRQVFESLRAALYEGRSFSQALQACGGSFPELYIATVRASERTGDLAEALVRFVDYQERLDLVRKKIVSASIYPIVLLGVGGLVTLFLVAYVVPRFSAIYAESGRDLPWLSRLLIEWGSLINRHGWLMAMAACALLAGLVAAGRHLPAAAGRLARRVPAIRRRLLVYHLARFYRTMGMLLRGGIPVVPALTMLGTLLPMDLRPQLLSATQRIREGVTTSQAMAEAGLTTPVASRMLRVGERSGDMAAMMDRIAAFHDDELARWVDWFTKLFEPLLMALIGVVIGGIVVLMYMPIFELAGSLQ
ncbi:MAG: type II secretion system F family protein [Ramlibacter sp.]